MKGKMLKFVQSIAHIMENPYLCIVFFMVMF